MPRPRLRLALLPIAALAAALVSQTARAADPMLVGFQDDPSFRWLDTRDANLTSAARTGSSVIRTTVYWSQIASKRPGDATDPFDPAYNFSDLDEFVRNVELRGMTPLLTIWGTPDWANGGKGQNYPPASMSALTSFARALASRYSGRNPGYPFVGYYSIWNEPNLQQFLAPTYDKRGRPVSPAIYARLARAAYAGIKAGNPKAVVAIGETSPRGHLKPSKGPGIQNSLAPALFAELVARVRPRVPFDAWAHHPYSAFGTGPTHQVRYPNVNLTQVPTFEKSLTSWFGRKHVPIWITEYGFETRPGEPKGVTLAQQAAYARQSLELAKTYRAVTMFVWFIFRDEPTSQWQSGLLREDATAKPALRTFTAAARTLDFRDPVSHIRPGTSNPKIRVPVWELLARDGPGTSVGTTISVTYRTRNVGVAQPAATIGVDGYVTLTVPLRKAARNGLYRVFIDIVDENGNKVTRTASLIST